jgi:hypothetical protein
MHGGLDICLGSHPLVAFPQENPLIHEPPLQHYLTYYQYKGEPNMQESYIPPSNYNMLETCMAWCNKKRSYTHSLTAIGH